MERLFYKFYWLSVFAQYAGLPHLLLHGLYVFHRGLSMAYIIQRRLTRKEYVQGRRRGGLLHTLSTECHIMLRGEERSREAHAHGRGGLSTVSAE